MSKKKSNPPPEGANKPPPTPCPPRTRSASGEDELSFKVQSKMCSTCIYRPDSPLDIKRLEKDVADPRCPGFFKAYRECHHAKRGSKVCCRGFWNHHKDNFTTGQIAQRLGFVRFVNVDVMPDSTARIKQERRERRGKVRRANKRK